MEKNEKRYFLFGVKFELSVIIIIFLYWKGVNDYYVMFFLCFVDVLILFLVEFFLG